MAVIVLSTALLIETVFAAYCILTRSSQRNARNFVRIGAIALFAILTLAAVIEWGFRWYGLAAVLFTWIVSGAWTGMRVRLLNKESKAEKEYKPGRIVLKAICMFLLVAIALIPALVFPEHAMIETTGKYKVATTLYTYTDPNRVENYTDTGEARMVNVEFWYPKDYDEAALHAYPLVVFSHGSFGIRSSNVSLYNELASHGYVVCSIDHTYHSLFTTDVDGNKIWIDLGYMQEVSVQDAHTRKQQAFEFFQKWMEIRTGDINFVIDTILEQTENNAADNVYRLIDTTRIGVMGHSLGGSAALGIGRMRDDISAVIALKSPFLYDIEGVENDKFVFSNKVYPVPLLNVYSDASWSHLSEWAQYAENFKLLYDTEATAFNVHIRGAGHLTLTDLALTSPVLTHILNGQASTADAVDSLKIINKICLEFFDSYLKGGAEFISEGSY